MSRPCTSGQPAPADFRVPVDDTPTPTTSLGVLRGAPLELPGQFGTTPAGRSNRPVSLAGAVGDAALC